MAGKMIPDEMPSTYDEVRGPPSFRSPSTTRFIVPFAERMAPIITPKPMMSPTSAMRFPKPTVAASTVSVGPSPPASPR